MDGFLVKVSVQHFINRWESSLDLQEVFVGVSAFFLHYEFSVICLDLFCFVCNDSDYALLQWCCHFSVNVFLIFRSLFELSMLVGVILLCCLQVRCFDAWIKYKYNIIELAANWSKTQCRVTITVFEDSLLFPIHKLIAVTRELTNRLGGECRSDVGWSVGRSLTSYYMHAQHILHR